jgi:hypothetical protein
MSVIPLVPGKSVAKTEEEFESRGARRGSTLLIRNFDNTQLCLTERTKRKES